MAETDAPVPSPHDNQGPSAPTPPAAQAPTTAIDAALLPGGSASAAANAAVSGPDDGSRKRPRDARLLHMILANQGVAAYQERVPLQLLDFCYRYTSATLQDALHLTAEFGQSVTDKGKIAQGSHDLNAVSLASLRLSIASRTHYQLSTRLPKDHLTELATEKNRVALPPVGRDWGMRLPPERYCLSGVGFSLRDAWESEGEEEVDIAMEEGEGEEEEGGRMEDLYGSNPMEEEEMDTKDG